MNSRLISAAALAALALGACAKKEKAESAEVAANDAGSAVAESSEITPAEAALGDAGARHGEANLAASEKFLAENGARGGVRTTQSGLQYEVLSQGAAGGLSPKAADVVDVHYVGTLIDGVEFDSSRARGAAARFPLNAVIPGWTEGVQLMREGDRFRFFVPPELAYGEMGTPGGPIGPNAALIFDVELLKVTSADRNAADAATYLETNGKKQGVKTTASGLQYEVMSEGPAAGTSPTDANIVRVHYKGSLLDGTEFDSSYARGEPAEFPLAQVIPGWTEGVQLMSVGDKFRFVLPPELAYGDSGTPGGPIGPNEALIFEVELLDVK